MKSLDSKLTIPMDMATEFMTQIAKLEGYGEEDAGKLANQQVKGGGDGPDVPHHEGGRQHHFHQPAIC